MAKKSVKRMHHRKQLTVPVAVLAGFAPLVGTVWNGARYHGWGISDPMSATNEAMAALTGFAPGKNPRFQFGRMMYGTIPIVAGILAHKIAGRLGVNHALSRMGIPFLRF